jgi:hypothetical protein
VRTTLDLDPDVLQAAKELAELHGTTAGKMISELARRGLERTPGRGAIRNGVPLMPQQATGTARMTLARVNELRDDVDG